jgi:hypothetical protein
MTQNRIRFSLVFELFRPIFVLKLAVLIKAKNFYNKPDIIKRKINAEFESVEKSAKKFTPKNYRRNFAQSNNSKKLFFSHFFVYKSFRLRFFGNFCNEFKSSIKFSVFGKSYRFFKFLIILTLFTNFECKRGRNGSYIRKKTFLINVS